MNSKPVKVITCPCSSVDRVPASGAGDESSTLSGVPTADYLLIPNNPLFRESTLNSYKGSAVTPSVDGKALGLTASASGRGPVAGRLVWDQEVGSSNLPAPTRYKLATT